MTDKVEEEFGLAEFGYFISSEERNDAEIMERTDRAIAPCFE
nr:hypothetical protein [Halomonas sp. 1513]